MAARASRQGPGPEAGDERLMRVALRLAGRALGRAAPNPAVGALIADDATGEIIARGWTRPGGRPHAETEVLGMAGGLARGRTMYVTLEPCSHHGRTPPCAEAIVAAGIGRVVCAIEDPDPRVSGRGIEMLRRAGVRVEMGACADEARWMAAGHILRMTQARPFVQLKLAVSADGLLARGNGAPRWVTGPDIRAYAHLLRSRADAILVGSGTVCDDDPELTCRLPGLAGASPRRFVLDARLRTPVDCKLVKTSPGVPLTIIAGPDAQGPEYPATVKVRRAAPGGDGHLDLRGVLKLLHEEGVTRLMVEGGPTIAAAFLDAGLVDEAVIARGTEPLGGDGQLPLVRRGLEEFDDARNWRLAEERRIGDDRLCSYRARRRLGPETE